MDYKEYVSIHSGWGSLQKYGINPLTGEADAYSIRLLCDLNEKGKTLMESFLGGAVTFTDGSNWNSQVDGDPAVAAVMLPYSIYDDLCRFILFHVEQKIYVHRMHSGYFVGTDEKWDDDFLQDVETTYVNYGRLRGSQPNEGGRNVHAMSGRTV